MNAETTHFEPGQLQRFLDSDLTDAEQLAAERHLEVCDECRQQLHQSAADVTWWEDASDFLTDDEFEIVGTASNAIGPTAMMSQSRQSTADDAEADAIPTDIRQIIAWLDPTDDPAMLGRLGGYEIAGVVSAGGMGVVLKGFDRSLNRYVAIKILAPHLATSGAAKKRFGREAQAAAAVVHDNVIAIHGVDESHSLPYLVMPYLRGTSLQRRIDEHGALSVVEILRLGMQTAGGLSAAHDQGLVHRDVKPANILLDGTTERVLLTDFGLARAADDASLTHSGVIVGTPYFMSPEQAEGAAIDHRSDLFSLGSVLYTMCTGRPPFRADTSWGILRKVTDAQPHSIRDLNPDIPQWLCEIIVRLHQKDPANRFQTAHEVADLLGQ
ncbi:MAG TPA: serine/threonine protein kinase [Planctomycetes bacterium]|nr:serine/threonine protein kinase [Fuerstiella sp.]HIK92102.1 serine/threonine protein kinase [Planctomycetota bacterium]